MYYGVVARQVLRSSLRKTLSPPTPRYRCLLSPMLYDYQALLATRSDYMYYNVVRHDTSTPSLESSPPILGVLLAIAARGNLWGVRICSPASLLLLPLRSNALLVNNAAASHHASIRISLSPHIDGVMSIKHSQDHVGSTRSFSRVIPP